MRIKERISSIVLIAVFAFAFFYCGRFPEVPQMMPRLISCGGILLSAGLLVKTFVFPYSDEEKKPPVMEKQAVITLAAGIAALVVYVVCITVIGYYVSSFVFMIALSLIIDHTRKWWQYPVVALGILLIIFAMFDWFLKVPLPKGLLF